MTEFLRVIFEGLWNLVNLGITFDGVEIKFWYLFALGVLIKMIMILIGIRSGTSERAGGSGGYKRKGNVEHDD